MTGKLSYEDDITVAQGAQIISFLASGGAITSPASPPADVRGAEGSAAPEGRRAGLSPRDVITSAGAKTNPEKIVAFALYVERQGGKDTFTIDDIKPLFRQARETTPRNLSRDLDAAIRSSWVAPRARGASTTSRRRPQTSSNRVSTVSDPGVPRSSQRPRGGRVGRPSQHRTRLRTSRFRRLSMATSTITRSRPRRTSTCGRSMPPSCGVLRR